MFNTDPHGIWSAIVLATRPDTWPDWARTVLVSTLSAVVAAALVVWRTQGIIETKLEGIAQSLAEHEKRDDKQFNENRENVRRAHERISRHIENGKHASGPITWPNQPPQK